MATTYPDLFPRDLESEGNRRGEKLVFNSFRTRLPDDASVYYSRNWRGLKHFRRSAYEYARGEADFIIIWPEYGILFVECKGGSVQIRDGQYFSRSRFGKLYEIKNPHEQAKRSMYRFIEHLIKERVLARPKYELDQICTYGAFFPESLRQGWASLSINQESTYTAFDTELNDPTAWVKQCFGGSLHQRGYSPLSANELKILHDCLSPSGIYPLSTASQLIETEQFFSDGICPTSEQSHVIQQLKRNTNILLFGSAGTGKTLIGLEALRLLSISTTQRSLFICHSQLLQARLKSMYGKLLPYVDFFSVNDLTTYLKNVAVSLSLDLSQCANLQELVDLLSQRSSFRFANVVIDEMQDLDDTLILSLRRLSSNRGLFLGLYDIGQNLELADFSPSQLRNYFEFDNFLSLSSNLRNTPQIVNLVMTRCPVVDIATCLAPDGPDVILKDLLDRTQVELFDIVSEICKLYAMDSMSVSILVRDKATLDLGAYRIDEGDGDTVLHLVKSRSTCRVPVYSISEFKGLESVCVIVWEPLSTLSESEAYVAMTRARSLLILFDI